MNRLPTPANIAAYISVLSIICTSEITRSSEMAGRLLIYIPLSAVFNPSRPLTGVKRTTGEAEAQLQEMSGPCTHRMPEKKPQKKKRRRRRGYWSTERDHRISSKQ